jgi:phosphatidylinositol alpha-mannosyltransferase
MKIALVSPYDFAYPGGVVNHITALERCFTEMGHQVKVIAPVSRAASVFDDRFIPIGRPRAIPTNGSIARITVSIRLAARIKQVLAEEHFDIIHFHEPFMPMLCTAMLRFSNTVNVATFHASHWHTLYGALSPLGARFFERRARKLSGKIAVSRVAMAFAQRYVPGPYTIIQNGIDLKRFTPEVPKLERFCDGKRNILFVGRLEPRKGCIYLLRAFEQVKKELPDTRLIIVGPGTRLRHKYEKWVVKHHLEQDVTFTGYVSNEELPRYYRTADIFCSPATGRESFGIVLLEAMAMGKPVVASNIPGYASVITNGAEGILTPPRDERALSRVLISLLNNDTLCREMGERGRKTAQQYRWEDIAQRILDFYLETLDLAANKKQQSESKQPVKV